MILGLAVVAALGSSAAGTQPHGEITVGNFPSNVYQVRPERSTSYYDLVYLSQVGEPLVEQNEVGEIIPGMAASWEISPDRKVYRFKIRDRLIFHDGSRLEMKDIVQSLNAAVYSSDNAAYYYLSLLEGYEGGREKKACPGIRALPGRILEMRLSRPYTPLLRALTSGAMVIGKTRAESGPRDFIGTGPYRVVRDERGPVLEAFPAYSGPYPPKIKRIRLHSDTRAITEQKKQALIPDFLVLYFEDQVGPLDPKEFTVVRRPGMIVSGFYANQKAAGLGDRDARTRLLRAVNGVMAELLTRRKEALGTTLLDLYPIGMLGHSASRASFRRLVGERSSADPLPGVKEVTIGVFSFVDGGNKEFAELFERRTGARVSYVKLSHDRMLDELAQTKADLIFLKWKSVFLDPETSLTPFQFIDALNTSSLRSQFETLRRQASAGVLNEERTEKYGRIADLVFDEALYLPVLQRDELQAVRKKIGFSGFVYRYSPMFSELELKDGR